MSKGMTLRFENCGHFAPWGDPQTMTLEETASWILKMSKVSPHEARNAYSALLLIPGWEALRFVQLIKHCKREWGSSVAKFTDFWDAKTILEKYSVNH